MLRQQRKMALRFTPQGERYPGDRTAYDYDPQQAQGGQGGLRAGQTAAESTQESGASGALNTSQRDADDIDKEIRAIQQRRMEMQMVQEAYNQGHGQVMLAFL